ncbi:MAG: hypothetical protein LBJ17_02800 [Dysgonamonadaceae bacterium]|jgi:hypothetical protein|nr:hypothetical protein [Dysgonamonadaceae bacterium]
MKTKILFFTLLTLLVSCNRIKDREKEKDDKKIEVLNTFINNSDKAGILKYDTAVYKIEALTFGW